MKKAIHPHEIMANFVNTYESLIKPRLKEEKLYDALKAVIMEHHQRYEIMEELPIAPDPEAKAYHRLALNFLLELTTNMEKYEPHISNFAIERIEAQVQSLDTTLHEDPHYKPYRETIK